MPVIGRLFSHTRDNTTKTEIVLLITPRLVRTLARPDVRAAEFAAGTEVLERRARGVSPAAAAAGCAAGRRRRRRPAAPPKPAEPARDQVPFGGVKPAAAKMKGFTLIELVIAVAIVAILASAALPLNELVVQRAKEQDLRRALREIRAAIDAYKQASDEGRIVQARRRVGLSRSGSRTWSKASRTRRARSASASTSCAACPSGPVRRAVGQAQLREPAGRRRREGEDVFDVYTLAPGKGINGRPYRDW